MAVYYKFKSARDYDSIPMDGPFISVGTLKEKIFESKHLGRGTDFDLVVTNAQTNEEYLDEAMLIPKNTSVLIRRVPGRPRMPIVTEQEPKVETKVDDTPVEKSSFMTAETSAMKYTEDTDWDEFGNDLYAIPEVPVVQSNNAVLDAPPTNKADEDSKIKALIDTPALDWQRQGADGFGPGRGFGRGMGGRMGGRGFGRLGLERKTPPQGYVCHRCKVPGHFIQHCPTNGDPNYDIKRVKPPTGIPKSMLMATPDGSYALPSGAVAVLKPNEAAFEKEIEGLPSTRSVGDLPPELHCPLCKEVMKDAVLTSKCCFTSFCDKCIRDYIISKAKCVCGATNILADDLLPNKTLRDTINRILESGNSSAENAGSTFQVQDMESARNPPPKIPSPTQSAASKEEQKPPPVMKETAIPNTKEKVDEEKPVVLIQQVPEKPKIPKVADVSEATHESMSVKEPASQGSAPLAEEEVQQKLAPSDPGKKKKKKKVRMPPNDLWRASQDLAAESYMMPLGPSPFNNPFWNGMQPGMESYMNPYAAGPMPFMGYGLGPLDMPFGGMIPPDPFSAPGYMMPVVPPQRDLAEFGMGMNAGPPAMSREEFEARKADLRRRRENERQAEREFSKEREFGREVSSTGDISSMKSKSIPPSSSGDPHPHHRHRPERPSPARELEPPPPPLPRPSKRKSDHDRDRDYDYHDYDHDRDRDKDKAERDHRRHHHHHHRSESSAKSSSETAVKPASAATIADRKSKASVFSRISFPEGETTTKKRKVSSSGEATATAACGPPSSSTHHKSSSLANGHYDSSSKAASVSAGGGGKKGSTAVMDYESSDDERHFKRKPSRYEPSPPPPVGWEEDAKHSRGSRERERERERKHR
ncbi:E3 ubiquitin ligase PARAQUAT TOLERANCE 3 isoform X1 [Jatropha curcas]|uniref:E3 ubiquitin ligase PARAQUAT TOLERANCE 3 isoform X1 n=1 Tax=Jatropha curcas TaxID=180498 RepID=UPI001894B5FE|nr:E3 ubiquitin ligase PARAQUAT TOLERANCE 3 isoform X1 [Jatropha curcas]XP_037494118.1 E3 ubiquitin ligase PARAQUAT TOLERANCE 3 isoform X1 [Jatropha curcas]